MNGNEILPLGLGVEKPWKITGQLLDTSSEPHELKLTVSAPRGAEFPCPVCGKSCKAHDVKEFTWRHLNFFQHRCYITASIPHIRCEEHGVKRIEVPWARKRSKFTLLFEQVAMTPVREMPVLAAARIMGITDKRLWRIVFHYVSLAMAQLSLCSMSRPSGSTKPPPKEATNTSLSSSTLTGKRTLFCSPRREKEKRLCESSGGSSNSRAAKLRISLK